jgi:transposase
MTTSKEIEAKILRYYHVEKWFVGTIAKQLHLHHNTVKRVLVQAGASKPENFNKLSIIDPYLPMIYKTLKEFPGLTASRLYAMVCERGYTGGPDHFRHVIALHRPKKFAEAYLRLRTLAGEQAQVDWGHFGKIEIGKAKRPLMAFVIVLSYSRKIFLRFYLNQQTSNFLRGHEDAFYAWGGIPKVILYDNLKSAVIERVGNAIKFNPMLLDFAAHYHFEPRPVAVARGNEKGRVERAIRYIRSNFFAARKWKNIEDLNVQAIEWCDGIAANRPCPEDQNNSVKDAFGLEKPKLLQLPDNKFPTDERVEVKIGKTPYVRFDLNDYSVPFKHVRQTVTVVASINKVTIISASDIIASHARSYDRGLQIEDTSHINELTEYKAQAKKARGKNKLFKCVPSSEQYLEIAAQQQYNLGFTIMHLLKIMDTYGAVELEAAISEVIATSCKDLASIKVILERRREERQAPPPIPIPLPNDERVNNLYVKPHDLKQYDNLSSNEDGDKHDY